MQARLMLSDSVALQELWVCLCPPGLVAIRVRLCLLGLGVILASLFPMGLVDLMAYLYPLLWLYQV